MACSWKVLYFYYFIGFYAFQSVFFLLFAIICSYFTCGFGVGNILSFIRFTHIFLYMYMYIVVA